MKQFRSNGAGRAASLSSLPRSLLNRLILEQSAFAQLSFLIKTECESDERENDELSSHIFEAVPETGAYPLKNSREL